MRYSMWTASLYYLTMHSNGDAFKFFYEWWYCLYFDKR